MKIEANKLDFLKLSPTQRDLLFLLCLSAVLKTTMALLMPVINHDGPLYIAAAQKIASGSLKEGIRSFHMPFYPLLIYFVHFIVPNWVAAALLVSLATSVLALVPLYLLTRDAFNQKAARWACIAFTLIPLSNHLSVEVMKDPSFLFFFAWAVFFAQRAIQSRKLVYFFLASLFSIFSLSFRLEGIIIFISYALFLLFLILRKSEQRIQLLKGMFVYLVFPLLIVGVSLLLLGTGWSSTTRLGVVVPMVWEVFSLKFLANYMTIYKQLEVLETTLPQKGGVQNFAEIARHYLFLVYLIGFLESFIKALFPFYLIPLVWGLWNSRMRKCTFVLFLAVCYGLMLYYLHLKTDSIRERFFLSLTFLLCPWIGLGLEQLFNRVERSRWRMSLIAVSVVFFIMSPVYKSVEIVWKQDDVFVRAGEWIDDVPEFKAAGLITNDNRISFYAGRDTGPYPYSGYSDSALERVAQAQNADLIAVKRSRRKRDLGSQFTIFKEVKKFVGKKNTVEIYCSPGLKANLDQSGVN